MFRPCSRPVKTEIQMCIPYLEAPGRAHHGARAQPLKLGPSRSLHCPSPALVSTGVLGSHTAANPGVLGFPGELDRAGRPALAPSCSAREKKMAGVLSGILITLM